MLLPFDLSSAFGKGMDDTHAAFWPKKLEDLKKLKRFRTYGDLAAHLGMSKSGLANVRSGRQELSVELRLKVLKELGGAVNEEDFTNLFPLNTKQSFEGEMGRLFDPDTGHDLEQNFWARRIDELKYRFNVRHDNDLARSLSISPSVISAQRAGKDALSPVAKIKILDKLGYTAARSLLLDLLPPRVKKRLKRFDDLRFEKRSKKRNRRD